MSIKFERGPFGWVHPLHGRSLHLHFPRLARRNLDWDMDMDFPDFPMRSAFRDRDFFEWDDVTPKTTKSERLVRKPDFELEVEVPHFKPEELDVKMVGHCVLVEGKHEEGHTTRHYSRRFELPDDVRPETVICNYAGGVLRLTAPRVGEVEEKEEKNWKEKTIPVGVPERRPTGMSAYDQWKRKQQSSASAL